MRTNRPLILASLALAVPLLGGCASLLPGEKPRDMMAEDGPEGEAPAQTAAANAPLTQTPAKQVAPAQQPPEALVKAVEGLDPAVQAQLAENLRQTPPELWPEILGAFKAATAVRANAAARPNTQPYSSPNTPPVQTLDGTPGSQTAATGSNLPQHKYDPREPSPAVPPAQAPALGGSHLPPAEVLAKAFGGANIPPAALAAFNDALENDAAAGRQVSYEEPAKQDDPRGALDAAIREMERAASNTVAGSSEAARRQIDLRLLYLAAGRRDDALRPLLGLTTAEQDYWSAQLFALSTWMDASQIPAADRRANESLSHLDRARSKLAEIGTLQLRNPQLCTRVDGFGAFAKFKEDVFKPKQDVVLYVEIENFRSETAEGGFRTALSSRYRILDNQGHQVVEHEFPAIEEVCKNQRRDYYISFRVTLPQRIYDGRHTLQLTIEDTLGKKVGQTSIEFAIKE